MNLFGLLMDVGAFLLIGIGFTWVIYLERYGGQAWAPMVFGIGLIILLITLFIPNHVIGGLVGIFGGTILWGASELKEQAQRCGLGWFKKNDRKVLPPWVKKTSHS